MIKANELRIGNVITFNNFIDKERIVIINARFFSSVAGGRKADEMKPDEEINNYYSGIPLTPEILEKCGFGKSDLKTTDVFKIRKRDFVFSIIYNNDWFCFDSPHFNHTFKYLHQLQNLYFALTGEELEIKL